MTDNHSLPSSKLTMIQQHAAVDALPRLEILPLCQYENGEKKELFNKDKGLTSSTSQLTR